MKLYKKIITLFTDGSCIIKNNEKKCGYGIYFVDLIIPDVSGKFAFVPLTNQRAELYAIYKAIVIVKDIYYFDKLEIYTDSKYCIYCITKWIKVWKKNGWKTASGSPVLNQDLILSIHNELKKNKNNINFYYVKSHSKNTDGYSIGNNIADKLAKLGSQQNN